MLWRNVLSVQGLTRLLARETLLWCKAVAVAQQAVSQSFLSLPSGLFERVFFDVLPALQQRWQQRHNRPLAASVQCAKAQFARVWIADGSTLEALFRKLDSLQDKPVGTLAGKLAMVVALVTRLLGQIWLTQTPGASDTCFESDLLAVLKANTLLITDRGFYHFQFRSQLLEANVASRCHGRSLPPPMAA